MISQVRRPIEPQIAEYRQFLERHVTSENPLVKGILDYILNNGGKGVRPILVMLAAALHAPSMGSRTYLAAMLVEMMHTASLVHDDVIDQSDTRRGKPSARAVWGARTAVVAGDLILAKSLSVGLASGQFDIVDAVVGAMGRLCEGELLQSRQSDAAEMTRAIYLDIVTLKTAVLFGASARAGAMSVGAGPGDIERMRRFGEAIGIAFQIKDDILDYDTASDTGKPACNDLTEKKITLPLLEILEKSNEERRAQLLSMLAEGKVAELHDTVVGEGGVEAAAEVMGAYIARAVSELAEYPLSEAHEALLSLASYAGGRNK